LINKIDEEQMNYFLSLVECPFQRLEEYLILSCDNETIWYLSDGVYNLIGGI